MIPVREVTPEIARAYFMFGAIFEGGQVLGFGSGNRISDHGYFLSRQGWRFQGEPFKRAGKERVKGLAEWV
ncbi:hypothetical protein AB0907_21605 [Streptomyces sp. NPDC006975]|uniref:hypothetical protein n=1 Tax=unclassified Streptomyces TaxID=2593676 RepID=UPI0034517913